MDLIDFGEPKTDPTRGEVPHSSPNELKLVQEEVTLLGDTVSHVVQMVQAMKDSPNPSFSKPLLKPRDIAMLELKHLRGEEGEGRLDVFFSQVEQCSPERDERQRIVLSRVDSQLAVYVQDVLTNGPPRTWKEFKIFIKKELTDQSQNRLYDSINELKYTYDEDPMEFIARVKCKFSLLNLRAEAHNVPHREKVIKNKLCKGMPKDCRDRLELFMDENISLEKFLEKLEIERIIANAQHADVPVVKSEPLITSPLIPAVQNSLQQIEQRLAKLEVPSRVQYAPQPRQQALRPYCPYCRSNSHKIKECRKNPQPGSCFDCLRMNCRRGDPKCPGRNAAAR